MTWLSYLRASLWHYARLHVAVALGVAVATAVLTGALLVGDSMRGSLRSMTLDRLGSLEELLITDHFFRMELESEVQNHPAFPRAVYHEVIPAILLPQCTLENTEREHARASQVFAFGIRRNFWNLDPPHKAVPLQVNEIAINAPLAEKLNAQVGDKLTLRFPTGDQVPADSPLARKEERTGSLVELKLAAIIPAEGLARFSLHPHQFQSFNAFVGLDTLQAGLEQKGRVNSLLIAARKGTAQSSAALKQTLAPQLTDFGLKISSVDICWENEEKEELVGQYLSLTSDRMLIDPQVVRVAMDELKSHDPQPVFTYLANRLERIPTNEAEQKTQAERGPISYSTICAVESNAGLGPCFNDQGELLPPLGEQEIYLNSWAAEDQGVAVGDRMKVTFFEPETTHGATREKTAEFVVKGIVPLTEPVNPFSRRRPALYNSRPTLANDPLLTPEVKGVTDQESIARWDAPFPVDYKLVRSQDDNYWENHRTTPKAFISLAAGQKLWGSRWGNVTSIRFPLVNANDAERLTEKLLAGMRAADVTLGFEFQPIKRRDLAASAGTTPFDALFLGLSFFLVAAALLLVVLLFRLGLEQRVTELGILLGTGWTRRAALQFILSEASVVALLGSILGVLGGVAYAWLMLAGLRSWWLGAIATPFLQLHMTTLSCLLGLVAGWGTSLLAIAVSMRRLRHDSIRQLLSGGLAATATFIAPVGWNRKRWMSIGCLGFSLALASIAPRLGGGEAQAGAFLGAGAAMLVALVLLASSELARGGTSVDLCGSWELVRLAYRNAARNPARSLLTLSLVASAVFLIVALSAFRLAPTEQGSGGFALVATSTQPLLIDLNDRVKQTELFAENAAIFEKSITLPFRVRPGDDASCRNLYQATQPRVLGVSQEMINYFETASSSNFAWAASAAQTAAERSNPWRLLAVTPTSDTPIPVVIDKNTAMFSLKLYRGVGEEFSITYPSGPTVRFRVVGLLANSVLQGSLLIGDNPFRQLFPEISGYRFLLLQPHEAANSQRMARLLEDRLSDQGVEVRTSQAILTELLAVQNTYISTFQTLGALGLVLGTFGVAAAQLRSVWERKCELGLLRVMGFTLQKITRLILLENIALLCGGMAMGIVTALLVVLPHMFYGGATIPWLQLLGMLGLVLCMGIAVSWWTTRAVTRFPLLASLRGE
jgi:putative ABC transport system permease protein